MVALFDVVDYDEFMQAQEAGFIRSQRDGSLDIWNYTKEAQYSPSAMKNHAVRQCRGLIVDHATLEVIARPFEKFFNYGQEGSPHKSLDSMVHVSDKADGSLGIGFVDPVSKKLRIATRGSFTSEMAQEANAILSEKYPNLSCLDKFTPLFEIIYPENRIVVDYGDTRDLFFLGAVDVETGCFHLPSTGRVLLEMGGGKHPPSVEYLGFMSLREALSLKDRANREGVVLSFCDDESMVKVKQEDYLALHKIVTDLTEKHVWGMLSSGQSVVDVVSGFPDEFVKDVETMVSSVLTRREEFVRRVEEEFEKIPKSLSDKDFAEYAKKTSVSSALFALNKENHSRFNDIAWKAAKP